MVGRELPNLRPNGEDHRGAGGGNPTGMLRNTTIGGVMTPGSRNWIRRMRMTRLHVALGCRGVARGLLAMIFSSQV